MPCIYVAAQLAQLATCVPGLTRSAVSSCTTSSSVSVPEHANFSTLPQHRVGRHSTAQQGVGPPHTYACLAASLAAAPAMGIGLQTARTSTETRAVSSLEWLATIGRCRALHSCSPIRVVCSLCTEPRWRIRMRIPVCPHHPRTVSPSTLRVLSTLALGTAHTLRQMP